MCRSAPASPCFSQGSSSGGGGFSAHWDRTRPTHCQSAEPRRRFRSRGLSPPLNCPFYLIEKVKEIIRGYVRELVRLNAFQRGDLGGRMGDEGGLICLAALRHGREKRCIRLDQQPLKRDLFHMSAKLVGGLEGHDPGD